MVSAIASVSYFAKVALDFVCFPPIPLTVFVDHVAAFSSSPMQYLI